MRLAILLLLVVPGLVLLATPALPLGLAMIGGGAWLYAAPGDRGDEGFIAILMLLGGLGALAVVAEFNRQRVTA